MTRTQYFTATSADGLIADVDNSLDWLFATPHGEDDGGWDAFIDGVGVLAMGATTYEWMAERHWPSVTTCTTTGASGSATQVGQRVRIVMDVQRPQAGEAASSAN